MSVTTISGRMTCLGCGSPSFHLPSCRSWPGKNRKPAMPEKPPEPYDSALFDQVTAMPRDEQLRLLFALCLREPAAVKTAIEYLKTEGLL